MDPADLDFVYQYLNLEGRIFGPSLYRFMEARVYRRKLLGMLLPTIILSYAENPVFQGALRWP